MDIILPVNGRKMTFTEQELIAIVEKHFCREETEQMITADVVQKPTEGKWLEVKPQTIDQTLLQKERKDSMQESTRQLILEAFTVLQNNPQKYGKNFKTMIPQRPWKYKTITELKEMTTQIGDNIADWVEEAVEWAQRITNGEKWEAICNYEDTANWFRLVVWKDGHTKLIGGARMDRTRVPASFIHESETKNNDLFAKADEDILLSCSAVPLIVSY